MEAVRSRPLRFDAQKPEVGAGCGNCERPNPRGGAPEWAVYTATVCRGQIILVLRFVWFRIGTDSIKYAAESNTLDFHDQLHVGFPRLVCCLSAPVWPACRLPLGGIGSLSPLLTEYLRFLMEYSLDLCSLRGFLDTRLVIRRLWVEIGDESYRFKPCSACDCKWVNVMHRQQQVKSTGLPLLRATQRAGRCVMARW